MYEKEIYNLKNVPVFSLADVSQIVSGKDYAKKVLKKMVDRGEIKKIKRDFYTFHNDDFLISTFLIKPSYISSVSALSYHKLISQIPKDVYCAGLSKNKNLTFNSNICNIHTNYFFGFEDINYLGFRVSVATPEKAIIDSIGIVPLSLIEEAFEEINPDIMIDYLKKIKKSEVVKRIGFLMEKFNFDTKDLKKHVNYKYIKLDPLIRARGVRNKKWRLFINYDN